MDKVAQLFTAALQDSDDTRSVAAKLGKAIIDAADSNVSFENIAFICTTIAGEDLSDHADIAEIVLANC